MPKASHGIILNRVLKKTGRSVVKYRRFNGYAVPVEDLDKVDMVMLFTNEDGLIKAPKERFYEHGIFNLYGDEPQYVLPVKYWDKTKQMSLL